MASDWLSSYSANLDIRDRRESRHKTYIDAYRLASRLPDADTAIDNPPAGAAPSSPSTRSATPSAGQADTATGQATLRSQLQAANTARATISAQLTTLQAKLATLQSSYEASLSAATVLERRVTQLETRVRDRDEELRGKSKLVEGVQDEMVALTLALNLAEEKVKVVEGEISSVRKENEDLVARWLARVGEEAERAGIHSGTDYRRRTRDES